MATAAVTYTFAALTDIKSSEANTNFDDLVSFLNTEVIQKDASVAFTGTPSGPAADPVSDNQYARKAYVDKSKAIARQVETGTSGAFAGPGPTDTDFLLSSVTVSSTRLYEVHLHSRVNFSAVSEWEFNFHVDGSPALRLDQKPIIGGDGTNMVSVGTLWLPSSGTYTLRVSVTRSSGAGTVQFAASGSAARAFYVKDIGPR